MPSKTKRQAATMRAASHSAEYARKMGIPQSVAREYEAADKRPGTNKMKSHYMRTKLGDRPE